MIMSTVHLPDELVDRLSAEATRRSVSVDDPVAEILSDRFRAFAGAEPQDALDAFIGCGRSGRTDLGRRHREILAAEVAGKSAADL